MALLIKHTGETFEVHPENGKQFTLKEYYKIIGCELIEIITLSDGRLMVCDEEAKLCDDWELNLTATELFRKGRMRHREYREYLMKFAEDERMVFIEATEDTLDCIAGDLLVGSQEEIA